MKRIYQMVFFKFFFNLLVFYVPYEWITKRALLDSKIFLLNPTRWFSWFAVFYCIIWRKKTKHFMGYHWKWKLRSPILIKINRKNRFNRCWRDQSSNASKQFHMDGNHISRSQFDSIKNLFDGVFKWRFMNIETLLIWLPTNQDQLHQLRFIPNYLIVENGSKLNLIEKLN